MNTKTARDLEAGDVIIDRNGQPARVTIRAHKIYDDQPRVFFSLMYRGAEFACQASAREDAEFEVID